MMGWVIYHQELIISLQKPYFVKLDFKKNSLMKTKSENE